MVRVILVFLGFVPFVSWAQIVINQSDMPVPGDTLRTSLSVNTGAYDFSVSGPDYTWDYQDLSPFSQSVASYAAVTSTPFAYQLFFLFTSNLALEEPEFDQFQGFEVTDTYRFFNNENGSYREVGLAFTLNGLPLPTVYENPDIIYQFPLQAGQLDSSLSSFSFDIPGLGYYGGWKKRKNTVDGWGTLKTPYGTFETLRLKAEIQQYDSLYIDSLGMGIPIYQEQTEYKWLGNEIGIPLLTVVDNGILQTIQYRDSVRNVFTFAVPSEVLEQSVRIYPNPVRGDVTIHTGFQKARMLEVVLYDLTGRQVYMDKRRVGDRAVLPQSRTKNLKGTYILKLMWEKGIKTEKLVFQQR
jgi:hypothetical protein